MNFSKKLMQIEFSWYQKLKSGYSTQKILRDELSKSSDRIMNGVSFYGASSDYFSMDVPTNCWFFCKKGFAEVKFDQDRASKITV